MSGFGSNVAVAAGTALLLTGVFALAQNKPMPVEQERPIKEAEVPKPALDALKKLADKSAITEFAEEIELGRKFYEGTWKGATGNVDALVTDSGDLVEIEESIAPEQVPARVRAAAEKRAGKDVKIAFEKKTMILYEIHFEKSGKEREAIFTPDGRIYREAGGIDEHEKPDNGHGHDHGDQEHDHDHEKDKDKD